LWLGSVSLRGLGVTTGQATSPLTALRVPGIGRALFATSLLMLSFYITYFFVGAHITLDLGLSTTQAGLVPLCYGIGFGLALFVDPLLDRWGLAKSTPPVFALISLSYGLLIIFADQYHLLLAASLIWGTFQHLGLNLLVARLTMLDPAQRGAIMGLYSTVTYLCVFAAPFLGGIAYAGYGLVGCLVISAGLCLAEALEALGLRRITTADCASPAAPA